MKIQILSFFSIETYVGSFYDGLRVKEATEFDLNVIIKIPCIYPKIKVEASKDNPGFVRLNVKDATIDEAKLNAHSSGKVWKKWIDQDGYLLHTKLLRWFESVLAKIANKGKHYLDCECGIFEVPGKKNGPANTLHFSKGNFNIDIDLVPVIEFPVTMQPPCPVRWIPTMKFRDANGLCIPSYYIKTLFLWEAFNGKETENEAFWRKPVSYLFPYMLVKLLQSLKNKSLNFFWHTEMNLYQTFRRDQLENMEGQVRRIIGKMNRLLEENDIEQIRVYIFKIFGITDINAGEIEQLAQGFSALTAQGNNDSPETNSTCILQ